MKKLSHAHAEDLAVRAVGWLASDPEKLAAFLSLTGLAPDTLRDAARQPAFLVAVLDFALQENASVEALAQHLNVPPETIAEAHHVLNPPIDDF
jgi:Protein of unknown function (DUF3572)